ncbi:MAG: ATP-binding protein, partial [Bacteroidota bacterium]
FVRGEAIQLGVWNQEKYQFEKYGWVPEMNSVVLQAKTAFERREFSYPEYEIGKFPGTDLPAVMNLHDATTHHLAILGITGAGKSLIAREIIRQLLKDTKLVCIDFTGEYSEKLKDLSPEIIVDKNRLDELEDLLAKKADSDRQKKSADVLALKKKIHERLTEHVTTFVTSQNHLGLFELPDLSNTTFILEFTQQFLDAVFKYVKDKEKNKDGKRVCIVIEEAHTVVPETSSLGDLGDYGSNKALVNKIGQIALQGRKYGVGFIIIAQRTANVSKTVLTQCNSIISFQAFDQTSFGFLENYVGKDLINALPNLKQYHAIVCGKGFKSNIPMIVDLTRETKDGTPS